MSDRVIYGVGPFPTIDYETTQFDPERDLLIKLNGDEIQPHEIFFPRIRAVWTGLAPDRRIIPFCTPVFPNPRVLVIGTNHSDFDPRDPVNSAAIADAFASREPDVNTFTAHSHHFARGLEEIATIIRETHGVEGFEVGNDWMGTNRCAVQTDSSGIEPLRFDLSFSDRQNEMDALLKSLVKCVKPDNVVLAGKYACALYYPDAIKKNKSIGELLPKRILVDKETRQTTQLIPVWHFSPKWDGPECREKTAERMAEHLV